MNEVLHENGSITFKPFENKKGVFNVKKYASMNCDSINERIFESNRKINRETITSNSKVMLLVKFFTALNTSGKLVNGWELGFKKIESLFIDWTDGKFTFNSKDENDLKSISLAIAYISLIGEVPTNRMLQVIKNRDGGNVVRLVDYCENFYQWTKPTKKATAKKAVDLNTVVTSLDDLNDDDLKELQAIIKARLAKKKGFKVA